MPSVSRYYVSFCDCVPHMSTHVFVFKRLATILPNKTATFYKRVLAGQPSMETARALKTLLWTEYVDDETQGEPSLAVEDFLEPDPAPFASKNWHYADAQTTRLDEEGKSSH